MSLSKALKARYPDLVAGTDYVLIDRGNGPEIEWLSATVPAPTEADIAAGTAAHQAVAYRALRAARYKADLGKDPVPSFENTVGDVLDVLIAQVFALASAAGAVTPDMAALVTKIATIKTEVPK